MRRGREGGRVRVRAWTVGGGREGREGEGE